LSIIVEFISYQQYQIGKNDEQSLINSYPTTLTLAITINDWRVPEDSDTISKKLLQCNEAMLFLNELINIRNKIALISES
jgi:hypothetical protein